MGRKDDITSPSFTKTTSSGKMVENTKQLSGEATDNPGRFASNKIAARMTGGINKGKLGGMNK